MQLADEVDVADHLALLSMQAKQVDHGLLDLLVHISEAPLAMQVCLRDLLHVLIIALVLSLSLLQA